MRSNFSISSCHSRSSFSSSPFVSPSPPLNFKYTLGFLVAISATSHVGKSLRIVNNREETRSSPTRKSKSSTSPSLLFADEFALRNEGNSTSKRSVIGPPLSSVLVFFFFFASSLNSLSNCASVTSIDVSRSRCTSCMFTCALLFLFSEQRK